jgi:phosphoglycolate phosphatase
MLEEILWECAVGPAQALMVGDTEYDMAMAQNLGVTALGVAWGVHPPERLAGAGAHGILPAVSDLPNWLLHRRTERA